MLYLILNPTQMAKESKSLMEAYVEAYTSIKREINKETIDKRTGSKLKKIRHRR
jgi:hypothetical protein